MNHPIPKQLITKANVTQEIEGHFFDYTLTFTVFGEVLEVQNHFLELPKAAKQLLVANKINELERLSIAYGNLFTYSIPFASLGYLEATMWDEVYEAITILKTTNESYNQLNQEENIRDEWLLDIFYLDKTEERLLWLLAQLFKENKKNRIKFLKSIAQYTSEEIQEVCPILIARIPTLKDEVELKHTYAAFLNFEDDKTFQFLSNRLEDEAYQVYHVSILYALSMSKKEALKGILFKYYKAHPDIESEALLNLTVGLSSYKTQEVVVFMKLLLSGIKYTNVGRQIIHHLKRCDIKEEEIANMLTTNFLDESDVLKQFAATHLFKEIENLKYLPSANQLMDKLEWGFKVGKLNINAITPLFKRRADEIDFNKLEGLLKDDNKRLRDAVLALFGYFGKSKQIKIITDQLNFPERFIKNEVINNLQQILQRHYGPFVLPILIDNLEDASVSLQEMILNCMKIIQKRMLPTEFINPVILLIQSEHYYVRKSALEVLVKYRGEKVKEAIETCLTDESAEIQEIAKINLDLINKEESRAKRRFNNAKNRGKHPVILSEIEDMEETDNSFSCGFLIFLLFAMILSYFWRYF